MIKLCDILAQRGIFFMHYKTDKSVVPEQTPFITNTVLYCLGIADV